MSFLPIVAQGLATQAIVAKYKERPKVSTFLRSFFKTEETTALHITVSVTRDNAKIAVDVSREHRGNANKFDKESVHTYEPPFFREYFAIQAVEGYERVFGADNVSEGDLANFVEKATEQLSVLIAKIEMAYELQCAQVFQTGIVTMQNGENIVFPRQATSMPAYNTAHNWATSTVDPTTILIQAGDYIAAKGKYNGRLALILGSSALQALKNNAIFKDQYDIKNITPGELHMPQQEATGRVLHGTISAGSYTFVVYTYPATYKNAQGVDTKYISDKAMIVLPEGPDFKFVFGGVPVIEGDTVATARPAVKKGAYHIGKAVDWRTKAVEYDVASAGIAIPVAVDQIFSTIVLA